MSYSKGSARPLSPHLTIYQPQLTWIMSIGHRITGAGLAALLYSASLIYVLQGAPKEASKPLITGFQNAPEWVKAGAKFTLAAPFFFHSYNGIRHLVWDIGRGLTLKSVYFGGWAVNVASVVSAALISVKSKLVSADNK